MPKYTDFDLDLQKIYIGGTLLSYTDRSSGCNAPGSYACGSGGGDYTERHPNDGPPARC